VPLAVLCLVLGLYPRLVTDPLAGSIDQTLAAYPTAVQRHLEMEAAPALADRSGSGGSSGEGMTDG
jgi:hypothetical protein